MTESVHVVPNDDLREHDSLPSCWCGPREVLEEGMEVPVYVHNSADGREFIEQGLVDEITKTVVKFN